MRRWELQDGNHVISVTAHETDQASQTKSVIFANGLVEKGIADSFAKRLVRHDDKVSVITYDEPPMGTSSYAESYRAELFDKVTRSLGHQSLVFAHSKAAIGWQHVGEALIDDEVATGLICLTPIGTSQLPYQPPHVRAARLAHEIIRPSLNSPASTLMTAKVIGQIARRITAHPLAAVDEITRALGVDTLDNIVATSNRIPTTLITGIYDSLVPTAEVHARLQDTSYAGKHRILPASHLGALADPRHSNDISWAIQETLVTQNR